MLLAPANVPCYVQIIDIHRQENVLPANLILQTMFFPRIITLPSVSISFRIVLNWQSSACISFWDNPKDLCKCCLWNENLIVKEFQVWTKMRSQGVLKQRIFRAWDETLNVPGNELSVGSSSSKQKCKADRGRSVVLKIPAALQVQE